MSINVKIHSMKALTLPTAREMLSRCIYGSIKYMDFVVPRQGNFSPPENMDRVQAFFTFYISSQRRVLHDRLFDGGYVATVISHLELQAVGSRAEEYIQDTLYWDVREDIHRILSEYDCQIMNGDREIVAVPYEQDGDNTILSYNTRLVLVNSISKEHLFPVATGIELTGRGGQLRQEA